MTKTGLRFDIHGLSVDIRANYAPLVEMISEELNFFKTKKNKIRKGVRIVFSTLPSNSSNNPYPSRFLKYRELSRPLTTPNTLVQRYGRTFITVINHLNKNLVEAAVAEDPSLFPDPACHHVLTQPLSPWLKKRGLFFIHSGCVADQGKGILIIGHSRSGKSTLTLSATRSGFKFFGDEHPVLSSNNSQVEVYPFPRRVRLDRHVAEIFPELRRILNTSVFERVVFHIEEVWPKCIGLSCTPKLLVFPRFRPQGRVRLTQIHASAALARLLQDDHFIWYRDGAWKSLSHRHLSLFERLANQATAFELDYGTRDILRIPSLFRRLLDGK